MAAFNRPTEATYTVHEHVTLDTNDREDHTFCGIMFPIKCKSVLPIKELIINTISIRGNLGPITVWVTNEDNEIVPSAANAAAAAAVIAPSNSANSRYNLRSRDSNGNVISSNRTEKNIGTISLRPQNWTKIYDQTHRPSFHTYCDLDLSSNPIKLKPGEVRGVYIHSTREDDEAIVYDNKTHIKTQDDKFLTVLPGRAHVSCEPFGRVPIWGWGESWRDNREFVGRIAYGVVYKLWNPREHLAFGSKFRELTVMLFACQRRVESNVSMLPDDVIYYILNMCRWDWVKDNYEESLKDRKKIMRSRRVLERQQQEQEEVTRNRAALQEQNESVAAAAAARGATQESSTSSATDRVQCTGGNVSENMESTESTENVENSDDVDGDDDDSENYSEESDEDDDSNAHGYGDHRSSNNFRFRYYDEYAGSDDEEEAEEEHRQEQYRRRRWIMEHFSRRGILHLVHGIRTADDSDESDDDESFVQS